MIKYSRPWARNFYRLTHTHTQTNIYTQSHALLSTIITIDQTENSIVTETQFKTGHT